MKRTFAIFVWLLFSSLFSLGNSAPPVAAFSEFLVDSLGNWTMELRINSPIGIDSIEIGFSSGSSMVEQYVLIPPGDYTLIDNSNLSTPLTVNSEGDYIIVRSWGAGYWHADSLAYGNYPGATLDCAEYGSSYASISINYFFAYAIDKSPTLGIENDTSGAVSNFTGIIYDPNGNLITTGTLIFGPEDLRYPIYAGGYFNGPIFAHRYYCDSIIIRSSSQPYTYTLYTINPVEFCETPGSIIYEEIICTTIVDITDYYEEKARVIVSPNPFSSYIQFYWDIPDQAAYDIIELYIFDQSGNLVLREIVQAGNQRFTWVPNEGLKPGMYIYHLMNNGESITSGKVIKI